MGKVYEQIDETLAAWMMAQPLWFLATAPLDAEGLVNVSPRGHDTFSVLGPLTVGWVDLTGSGVETIAHLRENGRICVMFASFDQRPRIVRLHGRGRVCLAGDPLYEQVVSAHPAHPATRAVIVVDVERVSDSCGYGVPVMDLIGERDLLRLNALKRGEDGMQAYRAEKNAHSLDGLPGL
jgi:hypothetical protein